MWIKAPGQISDNVYQITSATSSHFVIVDEGAGIVDTGVSALKDTLIADLKNLIGDPENLVYIFLTHTHFDHVGGIPYLRQFAPDVQVVGLPQTAELFSKKEVLDAAYEHNKACAEAMNVELGMSKEEWCKALRVDRIAGDGDTVVLGDDVHVKVIATPGHVEEGTSYYVLPDAALAGAEVFGGYGGRDKAHPSFTSSYKSYISTIDKLLGLEVKVLGLPHGGSLTGDLTKKFMLDARASAERFHTTVKLRLEQGELVPEIAASILPEWESETVCPEGPFVTLRKECVEQMVKVVAEGR